MAHPIDALLTPLSVEQFIEHWWGRRSLYIPGPVEKLAVWYSLPSFLERVSQGWPDTLVPVRASFDRGDVASWRHGRPLQVTEIRDAYASGATVCISQFDRVDEKVAAMCHETRMSLGVPGEVHANLYWSPDGAGFSSHFDVRVAMSLQLAGTKHWCYSSEPMLDWPRRNAWVSAEGMRYTDGENRPAASWELDCRELRELTWNESVLTAGDVLSLPAGAVHSARAEGSSLALNLHFNGVSVGAWLGSLFDAQLGGRSQWRHLPPLFAGEGIHGGPNARGRAHLRARLDEAIALLHGWRADLDSFTEFAGRMIGMAEGDAVTRRSALAPGKRKLRASPSLLVTSVPGDEQLRAVLGSALLQTSGETTEVFRAALRAGTFVRDELVIPGINQSVVETILTGLVEAGLLVTIE